jgi:putative transposase
MKRSRFSDQQIIGVLKENEAGAKVDELCRRHGISSATLYAWREKFGGMEVSDARRLRELERENAKLKRLLADQMLDNAAMRELLAKTGDAHGKAQSRGLSTKRTRSERATQLSARWPGTVGVV